jgi:hypothetical protein
MAEVARLVTEVSQKGFVKAKTEMVNYGKAANDAGGKADKMGKLAKGGAAAVALLGAAVVVTTGAVTAFSVAQAQANRENAIFARQAKETVAAYNAIAFATDTAGVSGEQFADISKDVSDKVGEFVSAGTGAFVDFVDVMQLTEEQARMAAEEFQHMSGREVLQTMVSEMEAAGKTGAQMTFVLESMGNEASRLIPLLSDNGAELDRLRERYEDATSAIALTAAEQQGLADLAETSTLLNQQLGVAAQTISAAFAPAIDALFGSIIDKVPAATNAFVDFFNTFQDAENINSIRSVRSEIEKLEELQEQRRSKAERQKGRPLASTLSLIDTSEKRLANLYAQEERLIAKNEQLANVSTATATGQASGIQGTVTAGGDIDTTAIERLRERYATEEELTVASYEKRTRTIYEALQNQLISQEDYQKLSQQSAEEYMTALNTLDEQRKQARIQNTQDTLGQIATLTASGNKRLFMIGKVAAIANATIDTAQGVTKALGSAPPPVNFINAGIVGAAGLLQVNQIRKQPMPTAREQGGDLFRGQATTIAEREAEVFMPKTAGKVHKLSDMTGGKTPIDVSVNVTMTDSGQPVVEAKVQSGGDAAYIRKVVNSDLADRNSTMNRRVRSAANG